MTTAKSDYSTMNDLALAQLAGSGDMLAFEQIYRRQHHKVYNLCLRILANPNEAEDLTQDVFVQLYKKIHTFAGRSAFSTWCHRITVNQVLMHMRKKMVKCEIATESSKIPDKIMPGSQNPRHMNIHNKLLLEQVIAELPPGYKNVFELHDIKGFEHKEIARILNCSEGTSKSQLNKAREKLKKVINKMANPKMTSETTTPVFR